MQKVSIIIPCYNYGNYLAEAIQSALDQDYSPKEVIVIDDGSKDNSRDVALSFQEVITIVTPNHGVSAARNIGAEFSEGDYLCFLDADDFLDKTYISKCMEVVGEYDIVGTNYEEFGDSTIISQLTPIPTVKDLVFNNKIHASALHNRKVWETLNGWDITFLEGYEDWDYWYRALKAGFSAINLKEPLLKYRKHGNTRNNKVIKNRDIWRQKILCK